jgi:hypothetical protein
MILLLWACKGAACMWVRPLSLGVYFPPQACMSTATVQVVEQQWLAQNPGFTLPEGKWECVDGRTWRQIERRA